MFKKLGFSDKDILEIKTGYKVIFKGVGFFLAIAIPVFVIGFVAYYYSVLDYVLVSFLILGLLFLLFSVLTAFAQSIGEDKLADREVVKGTRDDGSEFSYTVVRKK